jgi:hypothetical protein
MPAIMFLVLGIIVLLSELLRFKRIEFYDSYMRVFISKGKTKEIPYSQIELRIWSSIRRSILKLSVSGEGKPSSWIVNNSYLKDSYNSKEVTLLEWLLPKIKTSDIPITEGKKDFHENMCF